MIDLEIDGMSLALRTRIFFMRYEKELDRYPLPLSSMQVMLIESCLTRYDYEQAEKDMSDWLYPRQQKGAYVYKWVPGNHYYALDKKFNKLSQAEKHLKQKGYRCLGLQERFIYTRGSE